MNKKYKWRRIAAFAVLILLVLALPLLAGWIADGRLLGGSGAVSTGYGLSEAGAQYPFALRLYQQSQTETGAPGGEHAEVFIEYSADGTPLLEAALRQFLADNGVGEVDDWQQMYTYIKPSQSYYALYSPTLRIYAVALCITGSGSATASAYSIAQSDLELYDIVARPEDVPTLPAVEAGSLAAPVTQQTPAQRELRPIGMTAVFGESGAWVLRDGEGHLSCALVYVDYATGGISLPFCTQTDCAHGGPDCAAFIPYPAQLVDVAGQPFLRWTDADSGDYMGCFLYPDAAARGPELVLPYTFADYAGGVTDGRYVWGSSEQQHLISLDLADGGRTVLLTADQLWAAAWPDVPRGESRVEYTVWGADANGRLLLTFSRYVGEKERPEGAVGDYRVFEKKLFAYDIEQNTLTGPIWQHTGHFAMTPQQWGDALLLVDHAQDAVYRMDSITGAVEEIARDIGLGSDQYHRLMGDWLVWENPLEEAPGQPFRWRRSACNLATGEMRSPPLTTYHKEEQVPLGIACSDGEWAYVNYESVPVTITETVYGNPHSFLSEQAHYGFMRVEDLLGDELKVYPVG